MMQSVEADQSDEPAPSADSVPLDDHAPSDEHKVAPRASELHDCLECGYSRQGLERCAACPECGAPPPDPSWTLIRGWSSTESPWFTIFMGAVLALLVGGCSVGSLLSLSRGGRGSSWEAMIGGAVVGGIALLAVHRAVQRLRSRPRGGDLLWIVKPGEIEVRRSGTVRRVPVRSLSDVSRSRSLLRRWVRFQTVPAFLTTGVGLVHAIWVRRSDVDDAELLETLRQAVRRK